MGLIANKPCSFCGQQFYIGDEIPENFVADVKAQEKLGVLSRIPGTGRGGSKGDAQCSADGSCLYTQEQVEHMMAEAIEEAVTNTIMEMEQGKLPQVIEEGILLEEERFGIYDKAIPVAINRGNDSENVQNMEVPAMPEEIQQVFSIMQLNADEGIKVIGGVENENVLILLHAADSRKTIKDAAKKQAEKLFPTANSPNEPAGGNEPINASMEGADA